jgi:hypothetical protein
VETIEMVSSMIRPQRRWGVHVLPGDVFPTRGTLMVVYVGYRPTILPIWDWNTVELGTICIQRVGIEE